MIIKKRYNLLTILLILFAFTTFSYGFGDSSYLLEWKKDTMYAYHSFNIEAGFYDDSVKSVYQIVKKDPFIAGFLSWLMMGTGQIYCQEYTKGSIFMSLDLLDKVAFVGLVSYVNKRYSPKGDEVINLNWQAFDTSTKFLILGYIIVKYSVRFYNVYDAVQSAKHYNENLIRNVYKRGSTSLQILPGGIQLEYSKSF